MEKIMGIIAIGAVIFILAKCINENENSIKYYILFAGALSICGILVIIIKIVYQY